MNRILITLSMIALGASLTGCDNPWKKAENLEAQLRKQEVELQRLEKEKQHLQQEFDDYKAKYRSGARKKAEGELVGALNTNDGKHYEDVTISRVDDEYVYFTHSTGAGRVSLGDMPENWQERFDYKPSTAKTPDSGPETPAPLPGQGN